jgi:cell wall-associated NlpC family hydrolase
MEEQEIIKRYLGIPYKHRGRTAEGLDCYGLIKMVYRDIGIELMDINDEYTEDWSWKGRNHFIENYQKQWMKVPAPHRMDLVAFHNGKGIVNHAGIVLSGSSFIHTCNAGTVLSKLDQPTWYKRIEGFYRYIVTAKA